MPTPRKRVRVSNRVPPHHEDLACPHRCPDVRGRSLLGVKCSPACRATPEVASARRCHQSSPPEISASAAGTALCILADHAVDTPRRAVVHVTGVRSASSFSLRLCGPARSGSTGPAIHVVDDPDQSKKRHDDGGNRRVHQHDQKREDQQRATHTHQTLAFTNVSRATSSQLDTE